MMFKKQSLKMDEYSQSLRKILQCFFSKRWNLKQMKLIKSYRSNKKSYKKLLQKQRKANGNGQFNLLKYVRCHYHTRYEATMCPAQILTSQPSNTIF